MAVNSGVPQTFQLGFRLLSGEGVNNAIAMGLSSWASGLTATGTTQATALVLSTRINRVGTVAAGTGVALPPATLGAEIWVMNQGANSLAIYGNPTTNDTIDGIAAATGTTLSGAAGHKGAMFTCTVPGAWDSWLLGAVSS